MADLQAYFKQEGEQFKACLGDGEREVSASGRDYREAARKFISKLEKQFSEAVKDRTSPDLAF